MAIPLRSAPGSTEGDTHFPGIAESFEAFFDDQRTRLFGALAVMSGNRAEAEEVMQDAFLKVWRPTWMGLSIVTLGIWALATVLAIVLPVVETGSDPTQLPLGAFIAPVAAAMLTAIAGAVTSVFRRGHHR